MTRETKIGLLVGLAFIIVVAILLTNHTASTTSPEPAELTDAGSIVRQSVATPPAPQSDRPDPLQPEAARPPVPTRADLAAKSAKAAQQAGSPLAVSGVAEAAPAAVPPVAGQQQPLALEPQSGPQALVTQFPNDFAVAGQPADARTPAAKAPAAPPAKAAATPPVTAPKTYVAKEGDSVSRIASRVMGGNTEANRDALIKANPSLQSEGNVVYVGKTYVIPSAGATAQANAGSAAAPGSAAVAAGKPAFKRPPAVPSGTVLYTVKENDNLWRIAAKELGDGNLWPQIKDLNRDVLKGGEVVKPNMRIRLPRPNTATASVE